MFEFGLDFGGHFRIELVERRNRDTVVRQRTHIVRAAGEIALDHAANRIMHRNVNVFANARQQHRTRIRHAHALVHIHADGINALVFCRRECAQTGLAGYRQHHVRTFVNQRFRDLLAFVRIRERARKCAVVLGRAPAQQFHFVVVLLIPIVDTAFKANHEIHNRRNVQTTERPDFFALGHCRSQIPGLECRFFRLERQAQYVVQGFGRTAIFSFHCGPETIRIPIVHNRKLDGGIRFCTGRRFHTHQETNRNHPVKSLRRKFLNVLGIIRLLFRLQEFRRRVQPEIFFGAFQTRNGGIVERFVAYAAYVADHTNLERFTARGGRRFDRRSSGLFGRLGRFRGSRSRLCRRCGRLSWRLCWCRRGSGRRATRCDDNAKRKHKRH